VNRFRLRAFIGGCVFLLVPVGGADAATTYPASDGSSGACNFTGGNIDTIAGTAGGSAVPGTFVIPATAGSPAVRVFNCTTISLPPGPGVQVVGSNALELRATGAVDVESILNASGFGGGSGAFGGPGAGAGQLSAPSSLITGGPGAGGAGEGGAGPGLATGGLHGLAYGGTGIPGEDALNASGVDDGAGGGGAGSGGITSAAASNWASGAGSGGGVGGPPAAGGSAAGGGGGGGALRIVSPVGITVGVGGQILATGGPGKPPVAGTSGTSGPGGGGSGGVIALIAPQVTAQIVADRGGNAGIAGTAGHGASGSIHVISNDSEIAGANPVPIVDGPFGFTLTTAVSGSGTVRSDAPGIDCPADCADPYDPNAPVTLTAEPTPGSTFSGWSGDCAPAGTAPQCTVAMSADRSVVATFTSIQTSQPPGQSVTTAPGSRRCKKGKRHHSATAARKRRCKKKRG
jgi:hypothetical protein